jgi:RNA polymerase sigma factor (sigma-70 family)
MAGLDGDVQITTSLVVRVLDGDEAEWERLVHLYSPSIDGLMYRWCVPAYERDSLRNHVFAEAFASLTRFAGKNGSKSFLAWLWTITRRQVRLLIQSERARPDRASGDNLMLDSLSKSPAEPSANDYTELLRQTLKHAGLINADMQLLKLYYLEEQTASEVGRQLGITELNVRKRAARLLKRIRDEVADLEPWLVNRL